MDEDLKIEYEPFGHETGRPWDGNPPTARHLAENIADLATDDRVGLIQRLRNILVRDRATVRQRFEAEVSRLQSENTRLLGEDQGRERWITVEADRVLYLDDGKERVLCDRLPSPVTLVIRLPARSALLPIGVGGGNQGSAVAESDSEGLRPFASDSVAEVGKGEP